MWPARALSLRWLATRPPTESHANFMSRRRSAGTPASSSGIAGMMVYHAFPGIDGSRVKCHRAPDRRRRARTGLRPGRIADEKYDPGLGDAVQDRAEPQL